MQQALLQYLNNLQADIHVAAHTHVSPDWCELDFVHDYHRFYYIKEGTGWVRIQGKTYYPQAGQLFLLPAGQLLSYSTMGEPRFTKYWCHFNLKSGGRDLFSLLSLRPWMDVEHPEEMDHWFQTLIQSRSSTLPTDNLRAQAAFLSIIAAFLDGAGPVTLTQTDKEAEKQIADILLYMEQHLEASITLDTLADRLHFHPSHFIRFFKKHTGQPPLQYVQRLRMEKARTMLLSSNLTVTEICRSVGVPDLFQFSRTFKKFTGYSPAEYRKHMAQDTDAF